MDHAFLGQVAQIIIDGESGRILRVNSATRRLLGYDNGALVGESFCALFPPQAKAYDISFLEKLYEDGATFRIQPFRRADGTIRSMGLTTSLIPWDNGQAILATFRDTTEQTETERELKDSEQFLQNIFDGIQDGVSVLNNQLEIVRVNQWIEKRYAAQGPLIGEKCYAIYQKRESPCPWCPSIKTLETGESHREVVPYPSKENPSGWISLSSFALKDGDEKIIGVIEHVKDITLQIEAQQTLHRYAERLQTLHQIDQAILAAQSPQAIAQATLEHLQRLVSCQLASVVEFDFEAQRGLVLSGQVEGKADLRLEQSLPLAAFDVNGQVDDPATILVDEIQTLATLSLWIQKLQDLGARSYLKVPLLAQDQLIGALYLGADSPAAFIPEEVEIAREVGDQLAVAIQQARLYEQVQRYATELKQQVAERTAELKVALEQAQSADRLKSQFVSEVSHELRAPLTNLKLYTSLLTRGRPEKQRTYIDILHREIERLQNLIENLLDLSRLDLGKTPLNFCPTDINRLVTTLVTDRRALVADRGLCIEVQPAEDLPSAMADPKLIEQVLTNLLTNAVNYTQPGGTITLRTGNAQVGGRRWATISVADTGPGISEKEQAHLFERFYRGRVGRDSDVPGTGLGLAICKEIVDRHGGKITLKSQAGKGSTFTVWLPLAG